MTIDDNWQGLMMIDKDWWRLITIAIDDDWRFDKLKEFNTTLDGEGHIVPTLAFYALANLISNIDLRGPRFWYNSCFIVIVIVTM